MTTRSCGLLVLLHLVCCLAQPGEEEWQHAGLRGPLRQEVPVPVSKMTDDPVHQMEPFPGHVSEGPQLDTTPVAVVNSGSGTTPQQASSIPSTTMTPTPDVPVAQEIECFRKCSRMEGHLPVCATNGITYPNLPALLCVRRCHLPDIELAHFLPCDKETKTTSDSSWKNENSGERIWRHRRRHNHQYYAGDDDRIRLMWEDAVNIEDGDRENYLKTLDDMTPAPVAIGDDYE